MHTRQLQARLLLPHSDLSWELPDYLFAISAAIQTILRSESSRFCLYRVRKQPDMSSWAGFSDEDLQKLRQPEPAKKGPAGPREGAVAKKASDDTAKTRPQRAVRPLKAVEDAPAIVDVSMPVASRRAAGSQQQTHQLPASEPLPATSMPRPETTPAAAAQPAAVAGDRSVKSAAQDGICDEVNGNKEASAAILSESDGISREMGNLESFRAKQQMMEELNKKKKQMLESAIAERQKRTTAESRKLQRIQKDLAHIDQQLTVDVSILRNRIEEATRDFAEAQRRYDLAEKEFVAAKIDVHKKATMKEQLTEHLYTIIHQNELRKSKKLAELMEKLELEDAAAAAESAAATAESVDVAASVPPILLLDNTTSGVGLLKAPSGGPHLTPQADPAGQPPAAESRGSPADCLAGQLLPPSSGEQSVEATTRVGTATSGTEPATV